MIEKNCDYGEILWDNRKILWDNRKILWIIEKDCDD